MFDWLFSRKKVGLAFGGGVARGIAHIGVLKVLKNHKIPIDYIAATSSGSLVGAAFASGMDVSLIEQIALRIHWRDLLRVTFFQPGFIAAKAIEDFANRFLDDKDFSDMKIPLAVIATDIRTGEKVVIDQGKVAKAVAASAAFPGFFAPMEYQGRALVDGGIVSNLPVDTARSLGADFVIASDAVPKKYLHSQPKDALTAFGRALDLVLTRLSDEEAKRADILIQLQMEDEEIWHLDIHKAEKLITSGEMAAHRAINKIKRSLRIRS